MKNLQTTRNKLLGIIFLLMLTMPTIMLAQSPQKMSYQAIIRDASNQLITNSSVRVQISIVQGSTNGTVVYTEEQSANTNINGLVSLELGGGTIQSGNFSTIDWGAGPYFIKTETDPTGGFNYTISGISELLSVPYALYAANTGSGATGPTGLPGATGMTGPQGIQGAAGNDGSDGATGPTGAQGIAGNDGSDGATGPQGITGNDGSDGAPGSTGPQGIAGNDGSDGATGSTGPQGIAGNDGADGATGSTGSQGIAGNDGTDGATGSTGPQGVAGNDGSDGATGSTGSQGVAGNDGADGATGSTGPQGVAGNDGSDGATGSTGPQGIAGNDGSDGATGSTGSQGVAGNDGSDGATGSTGPQGITGNDGTGGATGSTGPQGIAGNDGSDGAIGSTGPQGIAGNDGADGATGSTGPQGIAGNDGATGPTGPTGEDNDWTISGNNQYSAVNGDVGIGTDSPNQKLQVHDAAATWVQVTNTASGTDAGDGLLMGLSSSNEAQLRVRENSPLVFLTNDAEQMRISNDGKVGIGTVMPADQLHVEGSIRMVDGNQQEGFIPVSDANGKMTFTNPDSLNTDDNDWVINGTEMYNNNIGNVGIGTTTPLQRLHIAGGSTMFSVNNASRGIKITPFDDGDGGGSIFFKEEASNFWGMTMGYNGGNDNDILNWPANSFNIASHNNDSIGEIAFSIPRVSGFVGLGVTDPTERLHVSGAIRMVDGNQADGYIPISDADGKMVWTDPDSITTNNNWTLSGNNLINNNTGNVGIGRSSAINKFSVDMEELSVQTVVQNTVGTGYAVGSEIPDWQSFTVYVATEITSIKLPHNSGPTTKVLKIYEGEGTSGNLLFTSGPTSFNGIAEFQISNVHLIPGNTYTLHLNKRKKWLYSVDNPFPDGMVGSDSGNDYRFEVLGLYAKTFSVGINGVGIAVDLPQESLDVNGNIQMRAGATAGYIPVSNDNGKMTWTDPSFITNDVTANLNDMTTYLNNRIVFVNDQSAQTFDDGSEAEWKQMSDFTGWMQVDSADIVSIDGVFRYKLVNGSGGSDNVSFRIRVGGRNGCTATAGRNSGSQEDWETHRGHYMPVPISDIIEISCTGEVRFALDMYTGGTDDEQAIDDVLIKAIKF